MQDLSLWPTNSLVVCQLSCPGACGIFPVQGWNPYPLHCKAYSSPLDQQGSPPTLLKMSERHGSSLVRWWLGFSTVTTGARVQSLDRELRSFKPCGTAKKKIIIKSKRGFLDSSVGKEFTCNAGKFPGSFPGSGRSLGEGIGYPLQYSWASLVAQTVKNLPEMQETWV